MGETCKALVAGGSLGGLMAGIELRAAGVDVSIHERSERAQTDRGAGIVMQPETLQMLVERCGLRKQDVGVRSYFRQYLNQDGSRAFHEPREQMMTSWGLLYRMLRSSFPQENYHDGDALVSFQQSGGRVQAHFRKSGSVSADLLVGSDGSRSLVRSVLFPQVGPRYAGYVAWRGVLPEWDISPELLSAFIDHFTFQLMPHSHILCYLIPGPSGELEPGERRLNWVWYWNVPEAQLGDLLTGRNGTDYDYSVPPGQVQERWLNAQAAFAEENLSPRFQELWRATGDPFVQPIYDLAVPSMRSGRVVLTGDAAFIVRPHTAASAGKAAANAMALNASLRRHLPDVDKALEEWEPGQLLVGQRLIEQGQGLGRRYELGE